MLQNRVYKHTSYLCVQKYQFYQSKQVMFCCSNKDYQISVTYITRDQFLSMLYSNACSERGAYSSTHSETQTDGAFRSFHYHSNRNKGWDNLHMMHGISAILLLKENHKAMSHVKGSKEVQSYYALGKKTAIFWDSSNDYHTDSFFFYLLVCIFCLF